MSRKHGGVLVRMLYVLGVLAVCVRDACATDSLHHFHKDPPAGGERFWAAAPRSDDLNLRTELRRLCPPGGSQLECYIRVAFLEPDAYTQVALQRRLASVCPAQTNRFRCFYKYVTDVLHMFDADAGDVMEKRRGKLSWRMCPSSMGTVDCFDNYMALWLRLVTSQEGKRTFGPGKRAKTPPADDIQDPGQGRDLELLFKRNTDQDGGCVERFGREACLRREMNALAANFRQGRGTPEITALRKRSVSSVCQDIDPIKCFEHYIFQLARYESQKQKVKGFIGKRLALLD